jgi:DNA-binding transcriptional regulator GbsR (MarR family)
MATPQFILRHSEPTMNPSSDELANVIIHRMGLMPRKKGSTEKIHRILVELYEKAKVASRDKNPTSALMTVEEMAMHAGISRQTMYDYIKRWLDMDFISKTSYIGAEQKVIIGYKLNGPTLESAFDKSKTKIINNVDITAKYIGELQRILKNEKISKRFDEKRKDNEQQTLTPEKLETPTIEKKEEDVGAVLSQFF